MKKFVAMLLALVMTLSLAACGQKNDTNDTKDDANSDTKELTYAVEAGSAGEAAAAEKGFKTVSVDTQAKALMEVDAGTADAAIIDLLMAGAMVGENTSYPTLKVTDQKLTSELYGVGCRKGSDLASFINSVMGEAYADGTMQELANTYGVQEALLEQSASEFTASETDSDVKYIQDQGTLIVGITEFAPMDDKGADDEWIGFDADMAKLVAGKLGVEVQFIVIDWDMKVNELDSKSIDVVWNGMTLTDDVKAAMSTSKPYFNNAQVVIVRADRAADIKTAADCKGLTFAVEKGSAGEAAATANGFKITAVKDQATALTEVKAGTSDAAVVDFLMAISMVGEGTDYSDLTYTVRLADEEYGVGFRKNSNLTEKLNEFLAAKTADGTLKKIAEKYGIQDYLIGN